MQKVQSSWKNQGKQLQQAACVNNELKKQISKQSCMDSLIQNSINDKIYFLKVQATDLTKRMQNQKYKNMQLQMIIKTIGFRMNDDKRLEAAVESNADFQNIDSLERKINKLEYDMDQMNNKANKVLSVVTDKKHKISVFRTERVIDSSIFRNIEHQLVTHELQFKKLLIQKIRCQKVQSQSLNEYNKLKQKATHYFSSKGISESGHKGSLPSQQLQEPFIIPQKNHKFKQIPRKQSQYRASMVTNQQSVKNDLNVYYEFLVKKFLMNIDMKNSKEFVHYLDNVQTINQDYFASLNQTADQISQLEQQICDLQKQVDQTTIKFYKPLPELSKHEQNQINCKKIKQQLVCLVSSSSLDQTKLAAQLKSETFKQFARLLQLPCLQDNDFQSLIQFFKVSQAKINQLKCYQPPKLEEVEKSSRTEKERKEDKLEDVMNRIQVFQESDKIMRKEQFREEYRKMLQQAHPARHVTKKKTNLKRSNF